MVSMTAIAQYLEGIDFPATKGDVLLFAHEHNAPLDVIDALERMPEGTFHSMAGIWDAVGEIS